ncbi:MAG: c-type cytochrome [Cyclobacteriaceae bacterium]|nr:c-type cytochrome [Cyclobacteriaceae bacterium]
MLFSNIKAKWIKRAFIMFLSFVLTIPAFAQSGESASSNLETMLIVVLIFVLIVAILILIIGLYLVSIIRMILLEDKKQKVLAEGKEFVPELEPSLWNKLMHKATDSVSIEEEETVMLDHDYDGIHELDNHLPPWWKWLFYVTIIWGFIYYLVYHVFDALPLMQEEYDIVMEDARVAREEMMALEGNNIDENNVEFSDAADVMANGKAIYDRECVACHAPEGQGLIGPNFTDKYWIHGGSINDIFKIIKYGVPQKGMISWQSKLTPSDMRDVGSFIMTFVGTTPQNPPAPKGPEGEEYIPVDQNQTSEEPVEQPTTDTLKVAMNK